MRTLLFFFAFVVSTPSFAAPEVGSETSVGKESFSQAISVDGSKATSEKDDAASISWHGSYTYAKTNVGTSTANHTNSLQGTFGYKKAIDIGGGLDYAKTPEENLTTFGPNFWLGYSIFFGESVKKEPAKKDDQNDDQPEDFVPSLEPKLTLGFVSYNQKFTGESTQRVGSKRTVTRPGKGTSESIQQSALGLGVSGQPWKVFAARASLTLYKYNKNVSRFIGLLDSPRAVAIGASKFSTTLGGLPRNSLNVGVSVFPREHWTTDLDYTITKSEADRSLSYGTKALVAYEVNEAWKVGGGVDYAKSVSQGTDTSYLANVSYEF